MVGSGGARKLPMLDSAYPLDVSFLESDGRNAFFEVKITESDGNDYYTYQWYQNGNEIPGATSSLYETGVLNSAETSNFYCEVTNRVGTVQSRVATLTVQSSKPSYTFSGAHELLDDGNYNWRIKLKSSGTLKFTRQGKGSGSIDIFCVGGGGGGDLHGGGGGYATTTTNTTVTTNSEYSIIIGAGGAVGAEGGKTSFGDLASAEGGKAGYSNGNKGGDGGSGGGNYGNQGIAGNGGSNGSDGGSSQYQYQVNGVWEWFADTNVGKGQGPTTREFNEEDGTLYAGGGGGGNDKKSHNTGGYGGAGGGGHGAGRGRDSTLAATKGTDNTGGGGGGGVQGVLSSMPGGSGIIVIRNHR
jgi:hypothetical protein